MPWGEKGSAWGEAGTTLSCALEGPEGALTHAPPVGREQLSCGGKQHILSPFQQPPGMESKPQALATALRGRLDLRSTLG